MWFYIFFSGGQVLLPALSWHSARSPVSEGVFLMYLWRETNSTSTCSRSPSSDQTKTPSPKRDNSCWDNILSASLPFLSGPIWAQSGLSFSYKTFTREKKDDTLLWHGVATKFSGLQRKLAKIKLFEIGGETPNNKNNLPKQKQTKTGSFCMCN